VDISLSNLALLYNYEGKYSEAEPLYKRVVAIREKNLGPEHPDVAQSLDAYAALLRQAGQKADAEKMEDRARKIRAKRPR